MNTFCHEVLHAGLTTAGGSLAAVALNTPGGAAVGALGGLSYYVINKPIHCLLSKIAAKQANCITAIIAIAASVLIASAAIFALANLAAISVTFGTAVGFTLLTGIFAGFIDCAISCMTGKSIANQQGELQAEQLRRQVLQQESYT